jgi:membrane protein DedA with SNARE-associated domain
VFLLMVPESACIPIPSEVTMAFAGYFAARGDLNLFVAAFIGALANLGGSLIAYAVGATGGRAFVVRWGRFVRLNVHHLDRAEAWFANFGPRAVFWSRMIPIVRTFISLPAGAARMELKRFSIYSFAGSLPWTLGLAIGGYELKRNWTKLAHNVELVSILIAVVLVGIAALLAIRARGRKRAPDQTGS